MVTVVRNSSLSTRFLHTWRFTGTNYVAEETTACDTAMGQAEVCKWLTFWQEEWMKRGYRGEKRGVMGICQPKSLGKVTQV